MNLLNDIFKLFIGAAVGAGLLAIFLPPPRMQNTNARADHFIVEGHGTYLLRYNPATGQTWTGQGRQWKAWAEPSSNALPASPETNTNEP